MNYKSISILLVSCFLSLASFSQNKDTLSTKLDSLKKHTDTTHQVNLTDEKFYNERTTMNGPVFGILLLNDFKQQALSPLDIKRKGWLTGAALVAGTVGISFLDKPIQRSATSFGNSHPSIKSAGHTISNVGGIYEGATFAAVAIAGYAFNNPKLRTTTALATQAYITSLAWSTLFKELSGRPRPSSFDDNAVKSSKLHGPFYTSNSSFPSQHATLAFAAARVYAMEYKDIPAIPIVAYSAASLITLSRLTENKHWATDLVAGALLGYACGTQVVNNYHRYAHLVRTGQTRKKRQKKGDISFSPQYRVGAGFEAGMVYRFR